MQTGEYIVNRILPDAVRVACKRHSVTCQSFSEDWILRLSKNGSTQWIFGYKFDINRAAAGQLAQDKVGTYEVLAASKIPAVRHSLVRAVTNQPVDVPKLQMLFPDGDVVIKPLSGTGGRGVQRYADIQQAVEYIRNSSEPAWAVSPYLDIVSETRLIVLDGAVLLAYEKQQPEIINGLKFYNLSRGAKAATIDQPAEGLEKLAVETCQALGLRLAAVDIVQTARGEHMVLEVNDGFSMEYYVLQSQKNKNRVNALYDAVIAVMFA